jgi:hypothetical protein
LLRDAQPERTSKATRAIAPGERANDSKRRMADLLEGLHGFRIMTGNPKCGYYGAG